MSPIHDLVPRDLRRHWRERGYYLGRPAFDLLRDRAAEHPHRAAVVDGTTSVDFETLVRAAGGAARQLAEVGVGPGDVVAYQMLNRWELCATDFAVAAVGGVSLPLLPQMGRLDLQWLLGKSGAVAYVTDAADRAGVIDGLRSDLPALRHTFAVGGDASRGSWRPLDLTGEADPPDVEVDPSGPLRILVSSGTEDVPKMVVYSHDAVTGGRGNYIERLRVDDQPMRHFWMVSLAVGFGANHVAALARQGATVVVLPRFDAEAAWEVIDRERPTHLFGVPLMYQLLLDSPGREGRDGASVQVTVSTAATPSPTLIDAVEATFGCSALNHYGSSDGVNCHTKPADPPEQRQTTAGRPNPAVCTIQIVDEAGEPCAPGETGEILARGPNSPMCYLDAPELDACYRTETGWVRTADLGILSEDGYLSVVGRMKDVINRGGYKFSAPEIEAAVTGHPSVRQAACVGMPDATFGERICAFVVLEAGASLDLDDLVAFLRDGGVSKLKLPERLEVLPELPVGELGKVSKKALRDLLL